MHSVKRTLQGLYSHARTTGQPTASRRRSKLSSGEKRSVWRERRCAFPGFVQGRARSIRVARHPVLSSARKPSRTLRVVQLATERRGMVIRSGELQNSSAGRIAFRHDAPILVVAVRVADDRVQEEIADEQSKRVINACREGLRQQ